MATENLNLNVNVNTNGVDSSVGSLKKQLREAQADVVVLSDKFGATSVQAIEAAKKVAVLKDKIGDAKALTDSFNPDAKFKALTASLSGVAGGFGAVQGAMALFGAESDDVQKTLLKVQSAMAISQGLQSLGESIDSFKNLGAVIKSTTLFQEAYNFVIGKKVVVTQADIAVTQAQTASVVEQGIAIVGTTAVVQGATGAIGNKVVVAGTDIIAIEGQTVATVQHGVAVVATTTAVTGATTAMKAFRIALIASGIGLLIVAIGFAVEAFSKYIGAAEKAAESQKKLNERIAEGAKVQLEGEVASLDRQQKLAVAQAKAKGNSEAEIYKIEQTYRQLKIDAQQRYHNDIANIDSKAAAATQNTIKNIVNEAEIARLAEQDRLRKLAEQKEKDDKKKANDLIAFNLRAKLQVQADDLALAEDGKKLQAEADKADLEAAKAAEEDRIKGLQYRTAQVIQINKAAQDRDKADKDALKQAELEFQNSKFEIANQGLNLIQQLAGQGTAVAKAAALSQIIIDTGRGFASGLTIAQASAKGTGPAAAFAFPIFYATQIAAVLGAVGKAKSILSQVPGGGIGGSISAPTMSQSPMSPQVPQAATTNISQESINDLGNKAVRAYVIESDVTSNQQRITAIRQRARFS